MLVKITIKSHLGQTFDSRSESKNNSIIDDMFPPESLQTCFYWCHIFQQYNCCCLFF